MDQERVQALDRLYHAGQLNSEQSSAYERLRDSGQIAFAPPSNELEGAGKALVSGVVNEGVPFLAGLPGDVVDVAKTGFKKITGTENSPAPPQDTEYADMPGEYGLAKALSNAHIPTSDEIKKGINKIAPEYEPKNFFEKGMKTTGSLVPMAAFGGARGVGGKLADILRYAAVPGFAAEGAASQVPEGYEDYARAAAIVASPKMASKIITPLPADPRNIAMAKVLKKEGIRVTPGAKAGHEGMVGLEAALNPKAYNEGLEQFTQRAGRTIGLDEPRLTLGPGGTFTKKYDEIKQGFDKLAQSHTLKSDQDLWKEMKTTVDKKINGGFTPEQEDNTIKAMQYVSDELAKGKNVLNPSQRWTHGTLTGQQYQNIRSNLLNQGEYGLAEALDNAMGRSIKSAGGDPAAWEKQRGLYKNAQVLKEALMKSTTMNNQGILTPELLDSVARSMGGDRYLRGEDAFSKFTGPAQALLKEPTPATEPFAKTAKVVGGVGGAAAPGLFGGGLESRVLGLLVGESAGPALQGLIKRGAKPLINPNTDVYWGNQVLPKPGKHADTAQKMLMVKALRDTKDSRAQSD